MKLPLRKISLGSSSIITASTEFANQPINYYQRNYSITMGKEEALNGLVREMIRKRKEERNSEYKRSINNPIEIENLHKEVDETNKKQKLYDRYNKESKAMRSNLKAVQYEIQRRHILQKENTKKSNVFDRLCIYEKCKHIENKVSEPKILSSRYIKTASKSPIKVEDRLIKYGKDLNVKLIRRRSEVHAAEMIGAQDVPRILNIKFQSSPYLSLIDRFKALENDRKKKLLEISNEVLRKELAYLRSNPKINNQSQVLMRNIKKLMRR